jgi:hypothetical protein
MSTPVVTASKDVIVPLTQAGIATAIANSPELSARMAELQAEMATLQAQAQATAVPSDATITLDDGVTYDIPTARATLRALISKGNKATKAAAFIGIKATLDEGEMLNIYDKGDDKPVTSFCLLNHTDASLYWSLEGWLGSLGHNLSHGKQGLWIDAK